MTKILIVDNDLETQGMIEQFLYREGYQIFRAYTARDALMMVEEQSPDIFLINTFLPGGADGLTLCRRLRNNPRMVNAPIIFLTDTSARYGVADALEAGGDDYVRKPFAIRELAARIRAHLRRVAGTLNNEGTPLLRIVPDTLTVYVNGRKVNLTQVEFDLLKFLCHTPHQLHTTETLLSDVWQYPRGAGDAALVRNHIRNLRRKLEEDPDRPAIIQSRHGRGYGIRARVQFESHLSSSRPRDYR